MRWPAVLLAMLVIPSSPALAHGQFPLPLGTLLDGQRADPRFVATFGLLVPLSTQPGYRWVCEEVSGGSMANAVVWNRTAQGTVLAGAREGLWRFTPGLCGASRVAGVEEDARIRAIGVHPSLPVVLVGLGDSSVRISRDDGRTFETLFSREGGGAFSILVEGSDTAQAIILWRYVTDGTTALQTWSERDGPGLHVVTEAPLETLWTLIARDPRRENQVYVLENGNTVDRVLRVDLTTGAVTHELHSAMDELAAGVSPSGDHILIGGLTDPMRWSDDGGETFTTRETLTQLRSVTFVDEDTVYAAANNWQDGFAFGISDDGAQTWRGFGRFVDIQGVQDCDDEASTRDVGTTCAPYWPALKDLFGIGWDAGVAEPPPDEKPPPKAQPGCPNFSLSLLVLLPLLRRRKG